MSNKSYFGKNDEEILLFVSKFVDPGITAQIQANPKDWDIKHLKYDWSLNE